jgi:uroporphyrinogen decarboxylase
MYSSALSHKERVSLALDHQDTDRPPVDLGGTNFTSLVWGTFQNLSHNLGAGERCALYSEISRACILPEPLLKMLDIDFRVFTLPENGGFVPKKIDSNLYRDEWGVIWRKSASVSGNYYYEVYTHPLAKAENEEEITGYGWPDFTPTAIYDGVKERAGNLVKSDYSIIGTYSMNSLFGLLWILRGMEQFLMDLALHPDFAYLLVETVFEVQKQKMVRFLEQAGAYLEVFCLCGDLGTQKSLLISPEMFRDHLKPFYKDIIATAKNYTEAKLFYHSCGNIIDLLDDFIECGIEIINPVQVSAVGMDPLLMKKKYGDKIVFWGGIDTQDVLPNGSEEDVREEVRLRTRQMGRNGGYVVAPVHNIQPDVPPENITVLYKEAVTRVKNEP